MDGGKGYGSCDYTTMQICVSRLVLALLASKVVPVSQEHLRRLVLALLVNLFPTVGNVYADSLLACELVPDCL